ncbi:MULTISPECIES: heparinase II/III family protein [Gordonia]|uniref:Heparinase II/III family protein n=1 Tax=Gordonia tangerina TaxID=2911060 RepID=A0ABS9DNG6_9ACTN|nr:alginate lyase family protein [Gordonia tangerina]MCF3940149.1 heparinase II/III family protein [Gordonia tangerina]
MSRATWYLDRLQTMSHREIGWRTSRAVASRLEAQTWFTRHRRLTRTDDEWAESLAAFREGVDRPVVLRRDRATQVAADNPVLTEDLMAAARSATELRFGYFGYPTVALTHPVDWNHDPISDVRWPDLPAARIDHRTSAGDVKWIWELNRLQHLVWLAEAWLITADDRFSSAACEQLDSWLVQNPPGQGIAWRGAFEAGIRAISISLALQGLRDSPQLTVARFRATVEMLAAGAHRCWDERSLFSSANNHLIGEMAGLAVTAIIFPDLPAASRWEHRALSTLIAQSDKQILGDGMGSEQAVGYQMFTAELMLVVAHLLEQRDGSAPTELFEGPLRGARLLASIVGEDSPPPRFGDDDEGFALRLGAEPTRTVRQHLSIVGAACGDADLCARGEPSLTADWLSDDFRLPAAASTTGPLPASFFAADGGLVVLRAGARRITMDVGPLGFLAIAAHGHADALAVTLSIGGDELISDPGPGSYYGNPQRRRAFRSTRAHATITVDGVDQSVSGGPFLWTRHAQTHVRGIDLDAGVVDAEHTGYTRLDQPVGHRRWLIAPPHCPDVVIVDLLTGPGEHHAQASWPIPPTMSATRLEDGDRGFLLTDPAGSPAMRLCAAATEELVVDAIRADEEMHLGWWSERLERAVPAWLLGTSATSTLPLVLATILQPVASRRRAPSVSPASGPASARVSLADDRITVDWQRDGAPCQIGIRTREYAAVEITIPNALHFGTI